MSRSLRHASMKLQFINKHIMPNVQICVIDENAELNCKTVKIFQWQREKVSGREVERANAIRPLFIFRCFMNAKEFFQIEIAFENEFHKYITINLWHHQRDGPVCVALSQRRRRRWTPLLLKLLWIQIVPNRSPFTWPLRHFLLHIIIPSAGKL